MAYAAFHPLAELQRLQDELQRALQGASPQRAGAEPRVNVWSGDEGLVFTVELPGFAPADVDVRAERNTLTLSTPARPEVPPDVRFRRRERALGPFRRSFQLPFDVDPERVAARFENGVLEIRLGRPEARQPRKIEVRAE